MRSPYGNVRLHDFVRALEAIVHPAIGVSRRQFVHRCGILSGRSAAARTVFEEAYDLRSAEEHLNEWRTAVPNEEAVGRLSVQSEVLACDVYLRLLEDATLRAEFIGDASTQAFWSQIDTVTAARWAPPFKIGEAELRTAGILID
jgi:hypothetical protein